MFYHLYYMVQKTTRVDFTPLQQPNLAFRSQLFIPPTRIFQMLALAIHYNFHIPSMIRFLGGNYTRNHLDVTQIRRDLERFHVPFDIIKDVVRIYTFGSPASFRYHESFENAEKFRRYGNHSSITQHLPSVLSALNKEELHSYCLPLPMWVYRFFQDVHCNPQGLIVIPGKNPRTISDSSFQPDADAVPVNHMHSNRDEPDLVYGSAFMRHLVSVYNQRITYVDDVIFLMDDDVAAAFRLPKYHPDIAGAFCHIVCGLLLISVGQTFGSNFSPHNFEPLARARQHVAEALSCDQYRALTDTHHELIDKVIMEDPYPSDHPKARAKRDLLNQGAPSYIRHNMYVDDNLYAATREYIALAIAASIESNYIVFGRPDNSSRRDTINDEKFYSTKCSPVRRQLGLIVDSTELMVRIPDDKLDAIRVAIEGFHGARRRFTLREGASLVGSLGHIACSCPWIRHLSILLRRSVHDIVRDNTATVHQMPHYLEMVRVARSKSDPAARLRHLRFVEQKMAAAAYDLKTKVWITSELRSELDLLHESLREEYRSWWQVPIAHLIPRIPDFVAYGDSCLTSMGGYCVELKFWWYIAFPPLIQDAAQASTFQTTVYDFDSNESVSINILEFAAIVVSYGIATSILQSHSNLRTSTLIDHDHPTISIHTDNRSAQSWVKKAVSSASPAGKAVSLLLCQLQLNNRLGLHAHYVRGEDNGIADTISRFHPTHLDFQFSSLCQLYPQLRNCTRFHLDAKMHSSLIAALSLGLDQTQNRTRP